MFNAKEVVATLVALMKDVTAKEVTSATVNAAVNCAAQITNLLKVHLDAKHLDLKVRQFEATQQGKNRLNEVNGTEED